MIGSKTGEIVGFGVMPKTCRTCSYYKNESCEKYHNCRKKWSKIDGSSNGSHHHYNTESKGHKVRTLDMDYDTSTICKIRSEVNPVIEKCSDKNHTLKNFTNHLFTLQKEKYRRILCTKVLNHIRKCFLDAVSSSREGSQSTK